MKIRQSHNCLIYIMKIPVPEKDFIVRRAQGISRYGIELVCQHIPATCRKSWIELKKIIYCCMISKISLGSSEIAWQFYYFDDLVQYCDC